MDKNVNLHDGDSYEDDEVTARDTVEEALLLQIKELEKELKSLLKTKQDLKKALRDCLDEPRLRSKILVSKIWFGKFICATFMKVLLTYSYYCTTLLNPLLILSFLCLYNEITSYNY